MGTPDEFSPQNRNSETFIDVLRGDWHRYFMILQKSPENPLCQIVPADLR